MNRYDFTQPGGFPLDQDVLGFMQNTIAVAAKSALLGGTTYVLTGCVQTGSDVTDGYVVIGGEILPFVGGVASAKVIIVENAENLTYEDAAIHPSQISRHATFGDDGVTNHLWVNFKRNSDEGILARIERLERIAAPFLPVYDASAVAHRGGMMLWKKPAILIPAGWAEVVDWRGRLPMGYDPGDTAFDEVGEVGGAKTKTLSITEMPAHMHVTKSGYAIYSSTDGAGSSLNDGGGDAVDFDSKTTDGLQNAGGGQAFSLLNPYRIVMFIEYTGS